MRETDGKGSAASALVPVSPAPLLKLVLDSLASSHSRRAYHRALGEFFAWYPSNASGEGFTRAVLGRYRSHLIERGLSAASVNLALAALRKLASEAAANGGLSPLAAAGIRGVPGARRSGVRTGNWLTLEQTQRLLAAPDPETTKGLRDRVLLGLLVGCGLRRGELAGLEFSDVAQREGRWAIVDLVGKHGRVRTVPMPSWAKTALDGWATAAVDRLTGAVLRRVVEGRTRRGRADHPAGGLRGGGGICTHKTGLGKITPHDLQVHLRQARPPRSGAARADSDQPGARLDPDHRALPGPQAEPARCALRSVGVGGMGGVEGKCRLVTEPGARFAALLGSWRVCL